MFGGALWQACERTSVSILGSASQSGRRRRTRRAIARAIFYVRRRTYKKGNLRAALQ